MYLHTLPTTTGDISKHNTHAPTHAPTKPAQPSPGWPASSNLNAAAKQLHVGKVQSSVARREGIRHKVSSMYGRHRGAAWQPCDYWIHPSHHTDMRGRRS